MYKRKEKSLKPCLFSWPKACFSLFLLKSFFLQIPISGSRNQGLESSNEQQQCSHLKLFKTIFNWNRQILNKRIFSISFCSGTFYIILCNSQGIISINIVYLNYECKYVLYNLDDSLVFRRTRMTNSFENSLPGWQLGKHCQLW